MLTTIELDENNRMLRFGFGLNEGRWFVRIDLWWVGFRLTGKREEFPSTQLIQALEKPVTEYPMAPTEGQIFFSPEAGFLIYQDSEWNPLSSTPQSGVIPELAMDLKPFTSEDHPSGATPSSLDGMGREFR